MGREVYNINDLAPVCIITCNRAEHLKNLIDSISRNNLAKYTDIFINVDYPPCDKYLDGYNKVCNYLKQLNDYCVFKTINVNYLKNNLGPENNLKELVNYVFGMYEKIIIMEDDLVVTKDYLEYMNICLEKFRDNEQINSICGEDHYDIITKGEDNIYLSYKVNCYGWGVWKHKYYKMINQLNRSWLDSKVRTPFIWMKFKRVFDFNRFIDNLMKERDEFAVYDGMYSIYLQLNDEYIVRPLNTKVLHKGFDGSGINMKKNKYEQNKEFKDDSEHFCLIMKNIYNKKIIHRNTKVNDAGKITFKYIWKFVLLHYFGKKKIFK